MSGGQVDKDMHGSVSGQEASGQGSKKWLPSEVMDVCSKKRICCSL